MNLLAVFQGYRCTFISVSCITQLHNFKTKLGLKRQIANVFDSVQLAIRHRTAMVLFCLTCISLHCEPDLFRQ